MCLYMRPDVLWCEANHRIALMDLNAQRYFTLAPDAEAAFRRLVTGTTQQIGDEALLAPVLAKDITNPSLADFDLTPASNFPQVSGSAIDGPGHPAVLPTASALLHRLATTHQLRRTHFQDMVRRLYAQKQSGRHRMPTKPMLDLSDAVASFLMTSKLVKTHNRCLEHSIAMFRFLASQGYFPNVVIGVKLTPWAAHAWVQDGEVVLNDTVDRVRPYTPILVI